MATVNFSIPEKVKAEFNQLYANEKKSAVLTQLIQEANDNKKRLQQRKQAMAAILELRKELEPLKKGELEAARQELRT